MKIAKKTHDPTEKDKSLTRFFYELSKHYNFKITFCSPGCPNQKGNVEIGVKAAKNIIKREGSTEFESIEHIQKIIDHGFNKLNAKTHPNKNNTRLALFKEEQALMRPLPPKPFIFFHQNTRRVVEKTSMISLNATKYEVPEFYKGERVIVKYNRHHLYIISTKKQIIAKYNYSNKKRQQSVVYGIPLTRLKQNIAVLKIAKNTTTCQIGLKKFIIMFTNKIL